MELRNTFSDREDLVSYCEEFFPESRAISGSVSPVRGGRLAGLERLNNVDPIVYGKTRNALDGAVTRLSPYLRHGVIGLAEAVSAVKAVAGSTRSAYKLLQELAWRDYWRRVLAVIGEGVWEDQEPYKTGIEAEAYAEELPSDFAEATTGNDFVDGVVNKLHETGYLHNQERMKIASYLVHWRRIRWQAGARWMLTHLLDGDLASNNLSWQWVASTFASKPYIFNQENLIRVSAGRYQGRDEGGESPFAGSYDEINSRLFS